MKMLNIEPHVARQEIAEKFSSHPRVLLHFNDMSSSQSIVLCSLLRGDKLTTAGNTIEADYGVTRLSAVVEDLEKKYDIPIEHINARTESSIVEGTMVYQTCYKMDEDNIANMLENPEAVFAEQRVRMKTKRDNMERAKARKLIKSKGGLNQAILFLVRHNYPDNQIRK